MILAFPYVSCPIVRLWQSDGNSRGGADAGQVSRTQGQAGCRDEWGFRGSPPPGFWSGYRGTPQARRGPLLFSVLGVRCLWDI